MTTQKIYTVGGPAGPDNYASIKAFATGKANGADLVTPDENWVVYVYADQPASYLYDLTPAKYDALHYITIRPAPGLGVNDILSTGEYGGVGQGIELTVQLGSGFRVGNGVSIQGFRINAKNFGNYTNVTTFTLGRPSYDTLYPDTFIAELKYNRIKSDIVTASNGIIYTGAYTSPCRITDNVFYQSSGAGSFIQPSYGAVIARNTFVRSGTAAGTPATYLPQYGGSLVKVSDCVFSGCGNEPVMLVSPLSTTNTINQGNLDKNYSDTSQSYSQGFTTSSALVLSSTDGRLQSGSAAIAGASNASRRGFDMLGTYRGELPDSGAFQQVAQPIPSAPTATITSRTNAEAQVNGQWKLTVTVTGTAANHPSSGTLSLVPDATTPNGAVAAGPVAVSVAEDGTWSATVYGVAAGNYQPPVAVFTNAGGTGSPATGGSAFTVTQPPLQILSLVGVYQTGNRVIAVASPTVASNTTVTASITSSGGSTISGVVTKDVVRNRWEVRWDNLVNDTYSAIQFSANNATGTNQQTLGSTITVSLSVPGDSPGVYVVTIGDGLPASLRIPGPNRHFSSIKAFSTFASTYRFDTEQKSIHAYVYSDLVSEEYTTLFPAYATDDYYVKLSPAPGLSVNDLDNSGAFGYHEYLGIEVWCHIGHNPAFGRGCSIEGFKFRPGNTAAYFPSGGGLLTMSKGATSVSSLVLEFKKNRCLMTGPIANKMFSTGGGTSEATIADNLLIMDGVTGLVVDSGYNTIVKRNTVVRLNAGAGFPAFKNAYASYKSVYDSNVLLGCSGIPIDAPSTASTAYDNLTITNNVTDAALTTTNPKVVPGVIYGGPLTSIVNGVGDYRPIDGGPLLSAASTTSASTTDILGNNRGNHPDVGAYQLHPDIPLATALITSVVIDGQTVTVSGTVTGSPSSGYATLEPPISDGSMQGPTPITLVGDTFTITWEGVPAGEYAPPTITVVNAGGPASYTTGGSAVNIIGIFGNIEVAIATSTPSGSITTQSILRRELTLACSTEDVPTAALVSFTVIGTGQVFGPYALNIDPAGTASIVLENLPTHSYTAPVITLSNSAGSSDVTGTPFTVEPPANVVSTITNQVQDNLKFTVSGTYSTYEVTDGVASVAAKAGGATDMPSKAVTIIPNSDGSGGTWTVFWTGNTPGEYYAPVVTFTNESGPSTATGGTDFTFDAPQVTLTVATCRFNAAKLNLSGTVEFSNDPSGTLTLYLDNLVTNTTNTIPLTVSAGAFSYNTMTLPLGSYRVRLEAHAWGEVATFTSQTLKYIKLSGKPVLPF